MDDLNLRTALLVQLSEVFQALHDMDPTPERDEVLTMLRPLRELATRSPDPDTVRAAVDQAHTLLDEIQSGSLGTVQAGLMRLSVEPHAVAEALARSSRKAAQTLHRVTRAHSEAVALGPDQASVRVAGLDAVHHLGQDNVEQRQRVVDVPEYLRMRFTPPVDDDDESHPEHRARTEELPPAQIAEILGRNRGKATRADTEHLVGELRQITRGRVLHAPRPQVGATLSRLAGLNPGDNATTVHRRLADLLAPALGHLPHDHAIAFAAVTGLPPVDQNLEPAVRLLTRQISLGHRVGRTVRRHCDEAVRALAAHLVDRPPTDAPQTETAPSPWPRPAQRQSTPLAVERRGGRGADAAAASPTRQELYATQTPYRVLLVDDHPLFLRGLRGALEDAPDIVVVGDAGNAEDAVTSVVRHRPDVVVMELNIPLTQDAVPVMCGPDLIRRITEVAPESKVLVLSMYEETEHIQQAVKAGARGYLLKDEKELVQAVRTVAEGKTVFDPRMGQALLTKPAAAAGGEQPFNLTRAEYRTVVLMAKGLSNEQIAAEIGLSTETVANLVLEIQGKLQGTTRRQDTVREHGIGVTPE